MNDYERQQEYFDKAMKNFIEVEKNFRELTPQNKEKFVEQMLGMYGMSGIINMFKNQR